MLRISGSERGKNCASSVAMGTQAHHALGSGWGGVRGGGYKLRTSKGYELLGGNSLVVIMCGV